MCYNAITSNSRQILTQTQHPDDKCQNLRLLIKQSDALSTRHQIVNRLTKLPLLIDQMVMCSDGLYVNKLRDGGEIALSTTNPDDIIPW